MKRNLFLIFNLIVLSTALDGIGQAQQLALPAAARAGGARAGRGQTAVDKPLADQPAGARANRGQAAANKPPSKPDELPKLTAQQSNLLNAMETKYLVNLKDEVVLTPAQAEKVGNGIKGLLRMSMRLAQQHNDLMEQAQKLKKQQVSSEEYDLLNQQIMVNERQRRNQEDNFFKRVSPDLSPEQQINLRIFMETMSQQIHQAIQDSRQ